MNSFLLRQIKRSIDLEFEKQFVLYFEKLKKADPKYEIFGSRSHQYKFGPQISESEILDFERKNKCKLPDPYKSFLINFGNGGAGPFYGIFALGTMGGAKMEPWPTYINAAATFRFTDAYNNDEILYVGQPDEKDFEDEDTYLDAYESWEDQVGEENREKYYIEHSLDGAIPICAHGCNLRSWLVVDEKSTEFGNIWEERVADMLGVEPIADSEGGRMNFAEWMLKWCTTSIHKLETR